MGFWSDTPTLNAILLAHTNAIPLLDEYHGHLVSDLTAVHSALRSSGSSSSSGDRPLIFTAGDSSLDNKYWFHDHAKALGGYEKVLRPPTMRQDVAYHLTSLSLRDKADGPVAINCAVEASTLNQRMYGECG